MLRQMSEGSLCESVSLFQNVVGVSCNEFFKYNFFILSFSSICVHALPSFKFRDLTTLIIEVKKMTLSVLQSSVPPPLYVGVKYSSKLFSTSYFSSEV